MPLVSQVRTVGNNLYSGLFPVRVRLHMSGWKTFILGQHAISNYMHTTFCLHCGHLYDIQCTW